MELYIEKGTNYAYTIERIQNISFRSLRSVVVDFTKRLPVELNKELYNSIQRGVCKLQNEPELNMYIYALGLMHEAKLQYAFEHLSKKFVDSPTIDIIDYGCGQAIGTICYADFLREKGYAQKVRRITLIEPSERALMRAALHVSCFFPKSEIITHLKEFDELDNNDINIDSNIPTLHIFSNVIDLSDDYFDLKRLAKIINDKAINGNQILCIEPYFDYINQDEKLERFTEELDVETYYTKIFHKGTFIEGHDWSCNVVLGYINHNIQNDSETLVSENVTQFESTINDLVHKGAKTIYNCHIKSVEYVDNIVRFHLYNPILGYLLDKGSGYKISEIKTVYTSLNSIFYALQEDEEYSWLGRYICEIWENQKLLNSIFNDGYVSILQQYIPKGGDCTNPFSINKNANIHIIDCDIIKNHCISFKFSKIGKETAYKIARILLGVIKCEDIEILREIADTAELAGKYKDAYQYYKLAAEENFIDAQYKLGYYLYNGLGVDKDCTEAIKWYIKAAEQGHATAQNELGDCYYNGIGVDQNYEEAVVWYKKAAQQGVASSQCNLGYCYDTGRGVVLNHREAFIWYNKAAEQGHAIAQYNLGCCYGNGDGVSENHKEAAIWYKRSAEKGFSRAQFKIGMCYEKGKGLSINYSEAIKWYLKAVAQDNELARKQLVDYDYTTGYRIEWLKVVAEMGYAKAQCDFGRYYYLRGDLENANYWYTKAADQNYVEALYELGNMCYFSKDLEYDNKYQDAVKWYKRAAENNYIDAQYMLGKLYGRGVGVHQDFVEAIKWYTKAAEQGSELAQYELAIGYTYGLGNIQDYIKAYEWFMKLAEGAYPYNVKAQYLLGMFYERGYGVEQNSQEAFKWYAVAAEQEYENAQFKLAECYEKGIGTMSNYEEALNWYRKVAIDGNTLQHKAQCKIGDFYYNGYGISQSYRESIKWYKKASEQSIEDTHYFSSKEELDNLFAKYGYSEAQYKLANCYRFGHGVLRSYTNAVKWYKISASKGFQEAQNALQEIYIEESKNFIRRIRFMFRLLK